jgi:pyrroline-5-carboxylate reductase
MKIAVIGVGNMGSAIMKGLARKTKNDLIAFNPANPRVDHFAAKIGAQRMTTADELIAATPDLLIFTTPAPITASVAKQFASLKNLLVLSAAAGVSIAALQAALPTASVSRMIPNIPVAVNAGTIGVTLDPDLSDDQRQAVRSVIAALGDIIDVKEDQLDVVGTVGGCSPAFVDVMMDALSDGAVMEGLDRKTAYQIVASMVKGSGTLAYESKEAPAVLRDQVASPGGTTIRGIAALEKAGFRSALIEAIKASCGE